MLSDRVLRRRCLLWSARALALLAASSWCAATLLAGSVLRQAAAGNFLCEDAELRAAAEAARQRSARFWSGRDLPGDWHRPCPIEHRRHPSAGGRTRFQFANGEVFGWRMEVWGEREEVLANILPHEVDHMVRASLTRRPVERWLDEGCAAVMESATTHARLRREAEQVAPSVITRSWLTAREYPVRPADAAVVYALGHSLVEFLLARAPAARLLAFQQDRREIETRLEVHYGLTIDGLRSAWAEWRSRRGGHSACAACGCPVHGASEGEETLTAAHRPLTVWTATWCGPCRQFWADLDAQPEFRAALLRRFQLIVRNVDEEAAAARAAGVVCLPTFELDGVRLTGYSGFEDLWQRLAAAAAEPAGQRTAPPVAPEIRPAEVDLSARDEPAAGGAPPATAAGQPRSDPVPAANGAGRASPREPDQRLGFDWRGAAAAAVRLAELSAAIGVPAATGGAGGLAVGTFWWWLRRRRRRPATARAQSPHAFVEGGTTALPAPFPRELDEARQLLELRQSEGRVAALDALRGMFLDDELDKLTQSEQAAAVQLAARLRESIDNRVAEVAPLSVRRN